MKNKEAILPHPAYNNVQFVVGAELKWAVGKPINARVIGHSRKTYWR